MEDTYLAPSISPDSPAEEEDEDDSEELSISDDDDSEFPSIGDDSEMVETLTEDKTLSTEGRQDLEPRFNSSHFVGFRAIFLMS